MYPHPYDSNQSAFHYADSSSAYGGQQDPEQLSGYGNYIQSETTGNPYGNTTQTLGYHVDPMQMQAPQDYNHLASIGYTQPTSPLLEDPFATATGFSSPTYDPAIYSQTAIVPFSGPNFSEQQTPYFQAAVTSPTSPSGYHGSYQTNLSENPEFRQAVAAVFEHDPNINLEDTKVIVTQANKLIPGMSELNRFLSFNGLHWTEGQKFKVALYSMVYNKHFVCENSKETATRILKKPCANLLCHDLAGEQIQTANDEALQQIIFLSKIHSCFNPNPLKFNTVGSQVHFFHEVKGSTALGLLTQADKPDDKGLADGIRTAGMFTYSQPADDRLRPVHLCIFTDGISRSSKSNFNQEIENFLQLHPENRMTISATQDDTNMLWFKASSSGGSQINHLLSLSAKYPGNVDTVEDFEAEHRKNTTAHATPSDYLYRLSMGVHDPAIQRDLKLFGTTSYSTKTQAMIKFGKEALPIIAKIGIKVALTV